ncbi:MAG: glutaredoxin family protein [Gallionella sp.]|nr:glutaredoxin family protein [Gallionella sp.]
MKHIALLAVLLAPLSLDAHAGELYRWMDSKGVMHYSDMPPPKSEQAETIRLSNDAGTDEALPYETLRAKQNFPVTLYVASGCGETCDQARSLLGKRGIPFAEKSLRTREDAEAFKQLSGIEGVPVLAVGKNYLKGFQAEQWQSELDIAGYPKTAPYRAPGKPSTPDASSAVAPTNPAE